MGQLQRKQNAISDNNNMMRVVVQTRATAMSEWPPPTDEQPQQQRKRRKAMMELQQKGLIVSRSKSQSRNNLLLAQQQKTSLEHFQMGRSKTATNLAFVAGGEYSTLGVDTLSLNRKGGGWRIFRASSSWCQFTKVVSAAVSSRLFGEGKRERERAEALPDGQFERVQRELKAFAERRHLALGRRRKVRIAELGLDQLHAQLATKQQANADASSSGTVEGYNYCTKNQRSRSALNAGPKPLCGPCGPAGELADFAHTPRHWPSTSPGGMAVVVKLCGLRRGCAERTKSARFVCTHHPPLFATMASKDSLKTHSLCCRSAPTTNPLVRWRTDLHGRLQTVASARVRACAQCGRFSVSVLRDELVCIVCEQRAEISEEDAFNWMVRVLQACESIHQLGIYCLALVPPNHLPKISLGGIYVTETRRRFLDGCLHPSTLLMCPQNCVLNLPKPREPPAEVGPAAMFVGNIVQGVRIAGAQGKELPSSANECVNFAEILRYRAQHSPEHVFSQLLKRAERIAALLTEKGRLNAGDHVALIFPPGLDLVAGQCSPVSSPLSFVPICIRPPSVHNFQQFHAHRSHDHRCEQGCCTALQRHSDQTVAQQRAVPPRQRQGMGPPFWTLRTHRRFPWRAAKRGRRAAALPLLLKTIHRTTARRHFLFGLCRQQTTGQLSGIVVTAVGAAKQCKSLKMACELYPSRTVTVCLDPYSGLLGFTLWVVSLQCLFRSSEHPNTSAGVGAEPTGVDADAESAPKQGHFLHVLRPGTLPEGICGPSGTAEGEKRQSVKERPRVQLCNACIKVFAPLGLSPRAVSTSFGCRVNPAVGMQGAASPDPTIVYVDARALRNDRVTLVEKGAPHSIALMESGKLLLGVKVVIANPKTLGQCADTHLGEIWVSSGHNASGFFSLTRDTNTAFARTGYLGFLRQTQAITADGELHDAIFVVGALEEALMLRGMRFHPVDIELSVSRAHRRESMKGKEITSINDFTLRVHLDPSIGLVAETHAPEAEALDLVPAITSALLEDHHLIVGVVVVLDPGTIPINSRGEKQRMHLRELFVPQGPAGPHLRGLQHVTVAASVFSQQSAADRPKMLTIN
ncbi:hypothetical protein niasHS_000703 [Heterodera schachtii]|uniref:AMP-binding enzyme C-terminal domain-containing protein n=1 Tax=Heterodera schachtii TaxID=97005 RepID=A0ABD2KB85_HETSC